ncbi:MAG: hypothetical protein SOZ04_01720 [Bacilli bacterium]|nr:hypothetical protein [Bacilli bacterium]
MKEIITKIYSSGNFPIVLFSTIGVLLVLFIITLLLAVSDTKKRQNKEKKESSSLDNTDLKDPSAMDNDIVMVSSSEGPVKENIEDVKIPESNGAEPVFEDIHFDMPDVEPNIKKVKEPEITIPNLSDIKITPVEEKPKETSIFANKPSMPEQKEVTVESIFKTPSSESVMPRVSEPIKVENQSTIFNSNNVNSEPVKVVTESPVINVKSIADIETEEYRIK